MSENNQEEFNKYAAARKRQKRFLDWHDEHIYNLDFSPPPEYIHQKYEEYLKENEIDRDGNHVPSIFDQPL